MTKLIALSRCMLIGLAVALAGCGNADSQLPDKATPSAVSNLAETAKPAPAPVAAAAEASISKERVLRAITCHNVLSRAVGVKMANADTGLPPDLADRLKVSALTRWKAFDDAHAQAAGVQDEDRFELIQSLNKPSPTAEDRQHTIDTVRDCLDNEP